MLRSKAFWMGVLATLIAGAVISVAAIYSGLIPMHATQGAGPLDKVGTILFQRAVALRAKSGTAPSGEPMRRDGLELFADHCLPCHGAPGTPPAHWVTGMLPRPPLLSSENVQAWSDGELFFIISEGVRMTGMPPFGDDMSSEEMWQLVAATRAMPALTDEERAGLETGREHDAAQHQAARHRTSEDHH